MASRILPEIQHLPIPLARMARQRDGLLGQSFGVFPPQGQDNQRDAQATGIAAWFDKSVERIQRALRGPMPRASGNDTPHPAVIGAELAELLPNAEQLNPWKGPEHLDEQCERVIGFLEKHTP